MASGIIGAALLFFGGLAVGLVIGGERGESPASAESQDSEGLEEAQEPEESGETALEEAVKTCAPHSSSISTGDDGHTLMIDRAWANENPGASEIQVVCVFSELEVPDFVISQIDSTRALDGTQDADFGDYSAFWTYHPDDGLNMTITMEP